jgi:hypothetical protein
MKVMGIVIGLCLLEAMACSMVVSPGETDHKEKMIPDAGTDQEANTPIGMETDAASEDAADATAGHILPKIPMDAGATPGYTTCPDVCTLNNADGFDCQGQELSCVVSWDPAWEEMCFTTTDMRYCNEGYWAQYCLAQSYICINACATQCSSCSDEYGCGLVASECRIACEQEN